MYPSKFLIFVASKLLCTKTKESKTNYILNHIYIYIYNEKQLHISEMHGLKKVSANTMYNLNIF